MAANPHSTREDLLDAAEELFGEHGFDGCSVREISKRAGATTASISYHFGGKAALYEAVIERRMREGSAVLSSAKSLMDAASQQRLTPEVVRLTVRTVVKSFFSHVCKHPAFVKLMTREVGAGFPVAKHVIQRVMPMEPLKELIEQAQTEQILREDLDSGYISAALFGLTQHFLASAPVLREVVGVDPMEPDVLDQLIDMNLSIIFDGIAVESDG